MGKTELARKVKVSPVTKDRIEKGMIVYSNESELKIFHTGICFIEKNEKIPQIHGGSKILLP